MLTAGDISQGPYSTCHYARIWHGMLHCTNHVQSFVTSANQQPAIGGYILHTQGDN